MGGLSVAELCQRHRRIGLDSNILIYVIERVDPWNQVAGELVDAVESGATAATISALGLAEILSGPARAGDLAVLERYDAEIRDIPGLSVESIGPDLAGDAAVIRGVRGMSLADAVHLASARAVGATAFVTNDRRLRGSATLEVIYLDELVPAEV
ncbi:MAG: type II toxin-antitoxin system VapC family toxin [Candidatus Limnocylindria bacterium]